MADVDEEEDPCPSPPPSPLSRGRNPHSSTTITLPIDTDLSEETQDFRFLSSLIPTSTTTHRADSASASISDAATPTIPKRGEKDFEPNPTKSQQAALRASRQAMHDALSAQRVHGPKNWVVGYFCGGVEEARRGVDGMEGSRSCGGGGRGDKEKRFQSCVVRIDQPRGPYFRTMGVSDSENRTWLLPEEALYLVERGSLDLRWGVPREESDGVDKDVTGGKDEGSENDALEGEEDAPSLSDLPMSLQGAYATFISDEDLTLARYTVFAGLRRSGYTVVRAPTWDESPPSSEAYQEDDPTGSNTIPANKEITSPSPPTSQQSPSIWPSLRNFLTRIFQLLFRPSLLKAIQRQPNCGPNLGPLVAPGLYRSYRDIYRALTLIPFHDPVSTQSRLSSPPPSSTTSTSRPQRTTHPTSTIPPFRICYHIYKPSTTYRKSSPPPPDFHLAVIDALSHPFIPSLTELGTLLEEMPIHDPTEDEKLKKARPEMRLRTGTRSVVLAVVDNGVVSFLRVAEMGSGRERIYEGRGTRGGGKHGRRGGVGGRRGRGRARG